MSHYRRFFVPGGTYFFTVTLADRTSDLLVRHVDRLRSAYGGVRRRHPFETVAICILPDHLHAIWSLPEGDADFPKRRQLIKAGFSRALPPEPSRSRSKVAKGREGHLAAPLLEHAIRAFAHRTMSYVNAPEGGGAALLPEGEGVAEGDG
jgi:putative transposase